MIHCIYNPYISCDLTKCKNFGDCYCGDLTNELYEPNPIDSEKG